MFCVTCFADHAGTCPKKLHHAPVNPGQRDELIRVNWGGTEATLRSTDGVSFRGGTGEPGVLICAVRLGNGRFFARIEDQEAGNTWKTPSYRDAKVAVANLHREIKRLARAGKLKS